MRGIRARLRVRTVHGWGWYSGSFGSRLGLFMYCPSNSIFWFRCLARQPTTIASASSVMSMFQSVPSLVTSAGSGSGQQDIRMSPVVRRKLSAGRQSDGSNGRTKQSSHRYGQWEQSPSQSEMVNTMVSCYDYCRGGSETVKCAQRYAGTKTIEVTSFWIAS